MKTAIYIEDGTTQLVLTPESEIDRKVLSELERTNLKTYRGQFYRCAGGWARMDETVSVSYLDSDPNLTQSLIFVVE